MQQMSQNNQFFVGSAVWGWYDQETGREYALYGKADGTAFVDVTDPYNPTYLGTLPTRTGNSIWRELATYQNYAYIVSDVNGAHGVQIFDLHNLRGVSTPQTFTESGFYNGTVGAVNANFNTVHTIFINEDTGYAYLNGSGRLGGSYHALSLSDPLNPTYVGGSNLGYIHDGLTVIYNGLDERFVGQEISFNSMGGAGFSILDVTTKNAPAQLSRTRYGNLGYTHQGWLTEDQRFFVMNDEFDENNLRGQTRTHLWELSSLTNPRYLGVFEHDTIAIDHNLFIQGNYVYMSNYTAGLYVYDLSRLPDVAAGTENVSNALELVAYFDTYFQDDLRPERSFNGSWGNYPYLPSGNVLVADRQNGLFVVKILGLGGNATAPEPISFLLMGLGMGVLYPLRRQRPQR
jgi:choice-of-anchor B domain-containing protein